jgi:N-acetylmuramoyl-L-alanine amidase
MIIIDPGHGGSDPGARSQDGKIREKDLNLSLAGLIAARLAGIPVLLTRTEDITLEPAERTRLIREAGARVCLSVHHNAFNGQARGMETIHSIHSDGRLARLLFDRIKEAGMPGRRVFSRKSGQQAGKDFYFIIRDTRPVETVIVEYGFVDNADDLRLLTDPGVREKMAAATAAAVRQYLGTAAATDGEVEILAGGKVLRGKLLDGVSYAPVRELATALGRQVLWDGRRVIIGEE